MKLGYRIQYDIDTRNFLKFPIRYNIDTLLKNKIIISIIYNYNPTSFPPKVPLQIFPAQTMLIN